AATVEAQRPGSAQRAGEPNRAHGVGTIEETRLGAEIERADSAERARRGDAPLYVDRELDPLKVGRDLPVARLPRGGSKTQPGVEERPGVGTERNDLPGPNARVVGEGAVDRLVGGDGQGSREEVGRAPH